VQPMVPAPLHGTLPSGHATEAFMFAFVLRALLRDAWSRQHGWDEERFKSSWSDMLLRQAERVAINRTVAGVHFPVDSAAGFALACSLARYFLGRCGEGSTVQACEFEACPGDADRDFRWRDYDRASWMRPVANSKPQHIKPSAMLHWLWREKATMEWQTPKLPEEGHSAS
jgi:hypothetical protein